MNILETYDIIKLFYNKRISSKKYDKQDQQEKATFNERNPHTKTYLCVCAHFTFLLYLSVKM
jgi:hypothetical protein